MKPTTGPEARSDPGFGKHLGQQIRSLFDQQYRRAFRNLRHLPRLEYRCVIDGGANRGSFTDAFLQLHRPERLVLVEALPDLAEKLRGRYAGKPGISVVSAALSDKNGEAQFEINRSEASSSLLPIDPRNTAWFGRDLAVARTVRVPTMTLPQLIEEQGLQTVDLLKLDLQGAERAVLTGGESMLERVRVIYTEVFFEPLYDGAWLFPEMHEFLCGRGFKLCGLSNIVHAGEGDLLQANATFRR
ncbi:MAG TPA: FkbM family methyltransferase [Chthoniobacterales bacterium]|nr:FkbM family methyltransferase [Chthoniobacterales bacterium]